MKPQLVRHGDCVLRPIELLGIKTIPMGLTTQKDNILEHGESGHKHKFQGQTLIYELEQPQKYVVGGREIEVTKFIDVKQDVVLTHEEHKTIQVSQGIYALVKERELDVLEQKIRSVMD